MRPIADKFSFNLATDANNYNSNSNADLEKARTIIASFDNSPDILQALDDFHKLSAAHTSQANLYHSVHPDKGIRDAAIKAEQEWKKLNNEVELSPIVFKQLEKLPRSKDKETQYWVDKMLREYRREGIDKDDETRARVKALKEEITELHQTFQRNINEDTRKIELPADALDGLPDDYIQAHAASDGKVTITTDYPEYIPFMRYCKDTDSRRKAFVINRQRAYPQNIDIMLKMFSKRQELADLLEYKTFADYRLDVEMVRSGSKAQEFIDKIDNLAKERSSRDKAELSKVKGSEVEIWDEMYLTNQLKKTKYALDAQAIREYFSYGKARDGILKACERIFDVKFEKADIPVWHEDVVAYHFYEDNKLAGRFYLDMHPRENKYKHAAEFDIRAGTPYQLPEASLVCNFPKGEDSLMEHSEVQTFFHEFGHLLHHLIARNRWTALAGISCQWDFVEAPSQMLEEWVYDKETLQAFATNSKGEPIPEEMINALRRSRAQGRGVGTRQQMLYAATSLAYHDRKVDDIDRISQKVNEKYGPYPYTPDTHFACSFGHLGGYTAAYYCYMWSQVIAQDMFTRFQKNLYDPKVTKDYKEKVLGRGGAEDAANFVEDFLGRPYGFDSFAEYLKEGE